MIIFRKGYSKENWKKYIKLRRNKSRYNWIILNDTTKFLNFKQKEFTAQQIAQSKDGIIFQSIVHLFKLELQLSYQLNRTHYISEITGWAMQLIDAIKRDKTVQEPKYVINIFVAKNSFDSIQKKMKSHFSQKYKWRGKIDELQYVMVIEKLINLLYCSTKEEVINMLNKLYPEN